ncbi:MAG: hypothetical protein LLG37_01830, partial [Spirochaetia bacterium]|nr:hypothetical protein [Spirochaetia bacterium]
IFRVEAVKTGEECMLEAMAGGKKYHVHDTTITRDIKKGEAIAGRVMAFRDIYVMTGPGMRLPGNSADMLKILAVENNMPQALEFTPLNLIEILSKNETAPEKPADIYKAAERAGISREKVDRTMERMRAAVMDRTADPNVMLNELVSDAGKSGRDILHDVVTAFFGQWNEIVADKSMKNGPLEITLVTESLKNAVLKEVKPFEIANETEQKRRIDEFTERWLDTPYSLIHGKTPRQAILEERESLGIARKDIDFSINFNTIGPDAPDEKAMTLLGQAQSFMQEEKFSDAIAIYLKYMELYKADYIVWYNLAMAYIMTNNELACLACLKNSLDIKPDYEFAIKGLNNLMTHGTKKIRKKAAALAGKYGIKIPGTPTAASGRRKKRKKDGDYHAGIRKDTG